MNVESLYNVNVTITAPDGTTNSYPMDKMSGGKVSGKVTMYRPGNGTNTELALRAATRSADMITLTSLYTVALNKDTLWIQSHCGVADATITKQPIDATGAPFGKALNYKAVLESFEPPQTDSTSDNASMCIMTFQTVLPVT